MEFFSQVFLARLREVLREVLWVVLWEVLWKVLWEVLWYSPKIFTTA